MIGKIFLRLFIVLIAVLTSILFYSYIIDPYVLEPTCLANTTKCVQIEYYQNENALLIHMIPTNYWLFFDGDRLVYTYGNSGSNTCSDPNFESVYVTDIKSKIKAIKGYVCIDNLQNAIKRFSAQSSLKYLYYRDSNPNIIDVYDVINYFYNKKIINLQ
jgi:hypothetical protein